MVATIAKTPAVALNDLWASAPAWLVLRERPL
jgi:hypothetical protein